MTVYPTSEERDVKYETLLPSAKVRFYLAEICLHLVLSSAF